MGALDPRYPTASVGCGQCTYCRRTRSIGYAVRIMYEADQHEQNAFITLTYRDIPEEGVFYDDVGLQPDHLRDFWKRFRFHLSPEKISYFAVGEYGEKGCRPHYHACVFGWYPDSAESMAVGPRLVTCPSLERAWGHGFVSVGELTPESAAYVAGYCLKKVTGKHAQDFYLNTETGEYRPPEFLRVSRARKDEAGRVVSGGVGAAFLDRITDDEFTTGVAFSGGVVPAPRYYKKKLKELDPARQARIAAAIEALPHDNTDLLRLSRIDSRGRTVQDVVDEATLKNSNRSL